MKYNLHARNGMNSSWYIFTFFGITSIIRITWVRHILRALSCHVTLWAKSSESYQQQLLSIGTCESWLGNVCWSTCHEKYCFFVGFAETPSCYLRSSGLSKYAGSGEREGGGTAHVQPVDSYAPLCVNSVYLLGTSVHHSLGFSNSSEAENFNFRLSKGNTAKRSWSVE